MTNPTPSSPLFEYETKDLCEELARRSPGGVYLLMLQPPVATKPEEVTAGFYYKVPNIEGVAKILGHTLMWFLGSRVMDQGPIRPPEAAEEDT
jgi:hypothetical protein